MFIFRLVRLTGIAWKGRYEKPCGREAFAPSDRCCHTSDFPYTGCFASYTLTNANFAVLLSFVRLGGLKKILNAALLFPWGGTVVTIWKRLKNTVGLTFGGCRRRLGEGRPSETHLGDRWGRIHRLSSV